MAEKRKKRIGLKIFLSILALLMVFVLATLTVAIIHRQSVVNYGSVSNWTSNDTFDINDYKYITIDENATDVKIMQLADPQIKFGNFTSDTKTMDLIDKAIKYDKPDIIVCTGDLTCSINTYNAYKYFADFMEEREQYWTVTYGNHDAEFDCSKYTIWKLLSNYKYCLFDCGPNNIYGESNHIVNVKRGNEFVYSLIMLDSNMYPESNTKGGISWVYDWIHQDQVEWYSWVVDGLKKVNSSIRSSAFWHIPTIEFAKMYYASNTERAILDGVDVSSFAPISSVTGKVQEADKNDDELMDSTYKVGIFYGGENSQEGRTNGQGSDIFEAIKSGNVTEGVFCGHDHVNTLRGYYDGVYLCYGRCSGYHTYPFFDSPNFLTKLMGKTNSISWNGKLWIDENGEQMHKGVTVIDVQLDKPFGNINVVDHDHAYYNQLAK